jgi:exonuclease III
MDILEILFNVFKGLGLLKTASSIQILTLNVWGLPDSGVLKLSQYRSERIQILCQLLKEESLKPDGIDVILLQEVWLAQDRYRLSRCGYKYAFSADWTYDDLDSGLMILSRHPGSEHKRLIYKTQGDWSRVTKDGEAWVRKSLQMLKVKHPEMGEFWVGNTHVAAVYLENGRDYNFDRRRRQMIEMADFADRVAKDQALVLGGDFNSGPGYAIWPELRQSILKDYIDAPNGEDKLNCTYCPPNVFVKEDEGKLDHILLRRGRARASSFQKISDGLVSAKNLYRVGSRMVNISDHYGWLVRIQ